MRDARRMADNLSAHQCTKSHIVIAYSQMPRTKATTKPATREAAMFMAMRTRSLYLPTIINPRRVRIARSGGLLLPPPRASVLQHNSVNGCFLDSRCSWASKNGAAMRARLHARVYVPRRTDSCRSGQALASTSTTHTGLPAPMSLNEPPTSQDEPRRFPANP